VRRTLAKERRFRSLPGKRFIIALVHRLSVGNCGLGVAKKKIFGVNIGVALVKHSSILFLFKNIFILQMLSNEQKYITINITRFKKS
jgi:hypothetical protein